MDAKYGVEDAYLPNYYKPIYIVLLTPKGMGLPYVGFSDSGQAVVNAFYF
jgi:hypothetical protein